MPEIGKIGFADFPEPLRTLLAPRVQRSGYPGEFFQVAAHQGEALAGFVQMTKALNDALPADLTEEVALSATRLGDDYERCQRVQLGLRLAFDVRWVAQVEGLDPGTGSLLTDDQRAVQLLVLALVVLWGHDPWPSAARLSRWCDQTWRWVSSCSPVVRQHTPWAST